MAPRPYWGNLRYDLSRADPEALFCQVGLVESAELIADGNTGRIMGFGLVELSSEAEAQAAMSGLKETQVKSRTLTVNDAQARKNRGGRGCGSGERGAVTVTDTAEPAQSHPNRAREYRRESPQLGPYSRAESRSGQDDPIRPNR